MTRYATRQDAEQRALIPALGVYADSFDIDAISAAVFEYRVDKDGAGNELLNTAGFEQVVTDAEFWDVVAKHDKAGS
jgi:hypothetical protein